MSSEFYLCRRLAFKLRKYIEDTPHSNAEQELRWMVITPSTLTINQSGIGVVLVFLVFQGSVDGHHSIHFDHQSI
ncbi:hypothetical protein ACN42_g10554 [Penicillium freii]|uniref:Uncharacterized protein n=1 Tax=Penicillium freii TaxID=48697 RepID=A0A101MA12_PENFR|nr:hypothetical protein ACN42_g10554 [Penicillium freii]